MWITHNVHICSPDLAPSVSSLYASKPTSLEFFFGREDLLEFEPLVLNQTSCYTGVKDYIIDDQPSYLQPTNACTTKCTVYSVNTQISSPDEFEVKLSYTIDNSVVTVPRTNNFVISEYKIRFWTFNLIRSYGTQFSSIPPVYTTIPEYSEMLQNQGIPFFFDSNQIDNIYVTRNEQIPYESVGGLFKPFHNLNRGLSQMSVDTSEIKKYTFRLLILRYNQNLNTQMYGISKELSIQIICTPKRGLTVLLFLRTGVVREGDEVQRAIGNSCPYSQLEVVGSADLEMMKLENGSFIERFSPQVAGLRQYSIRAKTVLGTLVEYVNLTASVCPNFKAASDEPYQLQLMRSTKPSQVADSEYSTWFDMIDLTRSYANCQPTQFMLLDVTCTSRLLDERISLDDKLVI